MNKIIKKCLKERSNLNNFFVRRVKKERQTKIRSKSCILHRANNES